jgi:hypothetical protein
MPDPHRLDYTTPKPKRRVEWTRFGWLVAAVIIAAVCFYCASLGNLLGHR